MSSLKVEALAYHEEGRPGKLEVVPTKPCLTARDLSLAYSPGVAAPCLAIESDPHSAYRYTNRGNLVAVLSNGTAVLGLGDIGALAGKPVMEGKAVLFKRFAGVDVFDIEIDTHDPDEVVRACELLEPTFGGINLEDIKAPECFEIEERLKASMKIPVFHDDQHGTAIISGAALLNAVELAGKSIGTIRVVVSGAGASALACARFFEQLGVPLENFLLVDTKGVVYKGRADGMNPYKAYFAQDTPHRTLAECLVGADVFLGCSAAGVLTAEMLKGMAPNPIVFALANPDPEITYEEARAARPDAIVATGRSDYPNQVNNVLGFPFIFRGALDVRATTINEAMKIAAARSLAALAKEPVPEEVVMAYGGQQFEFGPDYIIPKPFDPRLLRIEATAVAKAACESGVAQEPIADWDEYVRKLDAMTNVSERVMRRIRVSFGKTRPKVLFPDGENRRVLEACHILVQDGIGRPVLIGSDEAISAKLAEVGLKPNDVDIINPLESDQLGTLADELYKAAGRNGITPFKARKLVETPLHFGVMLLRTGQVDALVAGADDNYSNTLRELLPMNETLPTIQRGAGFNILFVDGQVYVIGDTTLNITPDARQLAQIAILGADLARDIGLEPKVAMLSFSNFGDNRHPRATKVRNAVEILRTERPDMIVDGEMHGDVAVEPTFADENFPQSMIRGDANVLICPDLDSANIAYKLLGYIGHGREVIGPILEGFRYPINVVSYRSTVREIANLAAFSASRATKLSRS